MDNRLTALIVHDIKNALGVLEGELSLLKDAPEQERATRAHVQCVGLRDKLIGFLTLYKADEQGLQARIEAVSPEDFLRAVLLDLPTARTEIDIHIDDAQAPAIAFFDEHLLGLALTAALQNALRFARTHITLSCRQQDGELMFTVEDDGPGLNANENKPSTGLGMTLCKAIAEAHRNEEQQGRVSLQNRDQGGARFTLTLP